MSISNNLYAVLVGVLTIICRHKIISFLNRTITSIFHRKIVFSKTNPVVSVYIQLMSRPIQLLKVKAR